MKHAERWEMQLPGDTIIYINQYAKKTVLKNLCNNMLAFFIKGSLSLFMYKIKESTIGLLF